ncbi:MAG: GNAT family N-acetyltransferase [Candidatus Pacebacteria bacterium]|nr:GNAT family N-acetyltransferase [Candidatus Paceibacterota bacterium]
MARKHITLRTEVYRRDMEKMAEWMEDDAVTKHLNETQNIDRQLRRLLDRTTLPVFSPQLNRHGPFFLITLPNHGPIGFLRLVPKQHAAEMVIVIGERSQWGNGYGQRAVRKGLKRAADELRKEKVLATIHKDNIRSRRLFRHIGFTKIGESEKEVKLAFDINT